MTIYQNKVHNNNNSKIHGQVETYFYRRYKKDHDDKMPLMSYQLFSRSLDEIKKKKRILSDVDYRI
jgi:hypothetical protein